MDVIVPMEFLEDFIRKGQLYMGLYRGDFYREGEKIVERWYTWKDSMTAEPDFHVPATLYKVSLL